MSPWSRLVLVAGVLGLSACQTVPPSGGERATSPESVGLSSERLQRVTQRMQEGIAAGEYPGASVLRAAPVVPPGRTSIQYLR